MADYKLKEDAKSQEALSTDDINWELTNKLKAEPKYIAFNNWAKENGVIMPNVIILYNQQVNYPVAFGTEGLIGIAAKNNLHAKQVSIII